MDDKLCLTQRLIEKSISKYSQDIGKIKENGSTKTISFIISFSVVSNV